MSQIMEKTLATLPKLLTQSLIGGGGGGGGSKTQHRRAPAMDVQNFMKLVHRARSKSHESQVVKAELHNVQMKLKQTDLVTSPAVLHSCFSKVLFCHLLGYNVNFVAIHAVNLAQQGRGFDKRLGYLMSCLLLSPDHEMVMLMMATLLRDIKSSSMADNCIALKVAGELVDRETIPTILPEVIKKFSHQHELVKEKAIHCFGAFYRKSPELLQPELGKLNTFLSSRDPGVLLAVTNVYGMLTSENPSQFVGLGSSFLHILDQINNRGFGSSYYYNMIPLPWLQISLLKVLGNIGHGDSHLSANVCPVLKSLIEKTKVSVPISLAILVESILTATKIHPNEVLLQLCSRCIMKLLASDSSEDMRYQGLGLLISLSRIKPSFASQHQVAVIECLTNDEPTIQSRTTLLLHAMANRANVKAICAKLFEQLAKTKDKNFRHDILVMIGDLADRLSPDMDWYISINLKILSHELPQITQDKIKDLVLKKMENVHHDNLLMDHSSINNLSETLFSVLEKGNYQLAEFSLAIQFLGTLAPFIRKEEFSSGRLLDIVANCLCFSSEAKSEISDIPTICSPQYFSDKPAMSSFMDKDLIKLKSQCIMTVTKMAVCGCIPFSCIAEWLDDIKPKTNLKNSFLHGDLDELSDLLRNPQDLSMKSTIFFPEQKTIDFSLSFLDSLVVKDMLQGSECYKPPYVKNHEFLEFQKSTLSERLSNQKDMETSVTNSNDSIMTESQTPLSEKKIPIKWRDDDVDDDDVNTTVGTETADIVAFPNAGHPLLNEKKMAAQELFAGLDEDQDFNDSKSCVSQSIFSVPNVQIKKGKTIWDDDDDDNDDDLNENKERKQGIFNVGSIGINPFGISTKTRAKSAGWSNDELTVNDDIRESVELAGSLNNNNNNSVNEYDDFTLTGSSDPDCKDSSLSNGMPWSSVREELPVAQETGVPTLYSNPGTDSAPGSFVHSVDAMSESTVDALTDSDPDGTES